MSQDIAEYPLQNKITCLRTIILFCFIYMWITCGLENCMHLFWDQSTYYILNSVFCLILCYSILNFRAEILFAIGLISYLTCVILVRKIHQWIILAFCLHSPRFRISNTIFLSTTFIYIFKIISLINNYWGSLMSHLCTMYWRNIDE